MNPLNPSPLMITIMIACYVTPEPRDYIGVPWNSQAGADIRARLTAEGLIDEDNRATERGKAWVEFICQTPLPEQKWILPEREAA